MKKMIMTIATVGLALAVNAQSSVINEYFEMFADDESVTKMTINKKMFSLFAELDVNDDDYKEFQEAVQGIDGMKLIVSEHASDPSGMYNKALKDINGSGYEELMSIKDAEENITFVVKEKNSEIEELLMLMGGNKSFMLMSIYGKIDLNAISKMAGSMNINGMEKLKELDENN